MSDFRAVRVKRGRITNYRTGLFQTFVYNPSRVGKKVGANLILDAIPGQADELVKFASGKANVIDFILNIDGEGRLRRSGVQLFNGAVADFPLDEASSSFSIAGELEFFESFFGYPVDPEIAPGQLAEPDLMVFTMGRLFKGILCAGANLDMDVFEFDPELSPTKAQLKFSLVRVVQKQRFATDIWDVPNGIGIPPQRSRGPQFSRGSIGNIGLPR